MPMPSDALVSRAPSAIWLPSQPIATDTVMHASSTTASIPACKARGTRRASISKP